MITPIQCATMHSGLTEQEVKEKYDWVFRALSEYGSRCVYDFLDGNSPEPAKHKPFIVGNVRDILDELKQEEITFGLFVEKLNAIARKFYEKPSEGASEGMAEALAKFFAKECKVGDPLLSIIHSIYDDWKLVYDKLRIETSFSEAAIQANKFVIEKYASLSPGVEDGSGWVKVEDRLPENAGWVNDTVMFWSKKHGHALIGCYDFEFDDWTQQPWTEGAEKLKSSDVTHWRPLPAPPGE